MTLAQDQWRKRRVDDYLDLYNYALALGDTTWQAEIVEALNRTDEAYAEDVREATKEQLWREFNDINNKMMDLFALMKKSTSNEEETTIREIIWKLKLQRIHLAKQIKEIC
ncbi:hypothetical protein [Paenibacillus sp. R14(2021)]|uniref:hypothetical protein n=1 Tax=Paenibacillus sp. R14(2021) TaxID=2859228 RepID=UPI001C6164A8|nr:hypothetical protein [Paenibacillus sp. R14(2021)]